MMMLMRIYDLNAKLLTRKINHEISKTLAKKNYNDIIITMLMMSKTMAIIKIISIRTTMYKN